MTLQLSGVVSLLIKVRHTVRDRCCALAGHDPNSLRRSPANAYSCFLGRPGTRWLLNNA